eukprot:TRINITY_DN48105_c0_g1_i1.p1 TRINITY_DN48105_c0_g1~~TRINITY_DN48105_c0_g1_i1.p1  ORF type:complete len:256 (+),score=88.17 TRINITY_DN48105_c0_g1_i1:44-811(+)
MDTSPLAASEALLAKWADHYDAPLAAAPPPALPPKGAALQAVAERGGGGVGVVLATTLQLRRAEARVACMETSLRAAQLDAARMSFRALVMEEQASRVSMELDAERGRAAVAERAAAVYAARLHDALREEQQLRGRSWALADEVDTLQRHKAEMRAAIDHQAARLEELERLAADRLQLLQRRCAERDELAAFVASGMRRTFTAPPPVCSPAVSPARLHFRRAASPAKSDRRAALRLAQQQGSPALAPPPDSPPRH